MSLIQEALEKANRSQETQTTTSAPAPKTWERDPMGATLNRELMEVQEAHAKRRRAIEKTFLAVLAVSFVACMVYYGVGSYRSGHTPQPALPVAAIIPEMPLKIVSGSIYRLTGITNGVGKPVAVVNDRIVSVGDPLPGDAVVKSIGNGEVRLDVQGKELKLTL